MIPNRFVILWNNEPIAIVNQFPIAPYPKKTTSPNEIQFFESRRLAEHWLNEFNERFMRIVEIQFRIMDE